MSMRTSRVRAWLLVKASNPGAAQIAIAPLLQRNKAIPDDYVVIRADIVADCEFNLVVPVDVPSGDALKIVVGLVSKSSGVKSITVARVETYCPIPAVEAHCYITEDETGGAYPEPGRYPRSPGANPWG